MAKDRPHQRFFRFLFASRTPASPPSLARRIIRGIVWMAVGLFSLAAVISPAGGVVGHAARALLVWFAGQLAFVPPLGLIGLGVSTWTAKRLWPKRVTRLGLALLVLAIWIAWELRVWPESRGTALAWPDLSWRGDPALLPAAVAGGSGVVGVVLTFGLLSFFGWTGAWILLPAAAAVGVTLLVEHSWLSRCWTQGVTAGRQAAQRWRQRWERWSERWAGWRDGRRRRAWEQGLQQPDRPGEADKPRSPVADQWATLGRSATAGSRDLARASLERTAGRGGDLDVGLGSDGGGTAVPDSGQPPGAAAATVGDGLGLERGVGAPLAAGVRAAGPAATLGTAAPTVAGRQVRGQHGIPTQGAFNLPDPVLLARPARRRRVNPAQDQSGLLEETFRTFGIQVQVLAVHRGPTVTRYELQPAPGVKVSRITHLADDIALALAATGVRIEAPIPGKRAIGIEVPNAEPETVFFRDVIESDLFRMHPSPLALALGKDIAGEPVVADLRKMIHLLIAGATGSGKSVCLNALIASLLFKSSPQQVRLLMIDPKRVELTTFDGVPHLMFPVVTDPKQAAGALRWAVREMEERYQLFAQVGARNIESYNEAVLAGATARAGGKPSQSGLGVGAASPAAVAPAAAAGPASRGAGVVAAGAEAATSGTLSPSGSSPAVQPIPNAPLPYLVVIIDELADLMLVAAAEVEDAIWRLAQMARAAGIHLVIATQRPSVDVITGVIKANIPSRIAFAVSSQTDSRVILDMLGAERLLGRGDMLFFPIGAAKPVRAQGALILDPDVERLVQFWKRQGSPEYEASIAEQADEEAEAAEEEPGDVLFDDAVNLVTEMGQASISLLQRRFRIGYSRAARLIDQMEQKGIVGPAQGARPREILIGQRLGHAERSLDR